MLRTPPPRALRPAQPQSLRRAYDEFVEQRIDEYKDQLTRTELLQLGDEAIRELELGTEDQFVLTEVLMLDHVDRLIRKRLRLPTFRRWRDRHLKLRAAQRQPTHWDLPPNAPLLQFVPCIERTDTVLVVGAGAVGTAFLAAAHGLRVLLIDHRISLVEAAERRATSEVLGELFDALVVQLGGWFPDVQPGVVVFDSVVLGSLSRKDRLAVIGTVQSRTAAHGVHLLLPPPPGHHPASPVPPEFMVPIYRDWEILERRPLGDWFGARKLG